MLLWFSRRGHNVPARRVFFMVFATRDERDFVIRISVPTEITLKIAHLTVSSAIWPLNINIYLKKLLKINF